MSQPSNNGNILFATFQRGEAHGLGIMKDSSNNILQKGIWKRGEFDQNEKLIDDAEIKRIEIQSISYSKMKFESANEQQKAPGVIGIRNQDKLDADTIGASLIKKDNPKLQDKTIDEKVTEKQTKSDEPKKKIKKVTPDEKKK